MNGSARFILRAVIVVVILCVVFAPPGSAVVIIGAGLTYYPHYTVGLGLLLALLLLVTYRLGGLVVVKQEFRAVKEILQSLRKR